jgi:manganese efflux pump family protein
MTIDEILIIAVGLAMDAFAVALGVGAEGYAKKFRQAFRLSFHFGLFQLFMPIIGWYLGFKVQSYIEEYDHWVAFILLAFVAVRMIRSGLEKHPEKLKTDPTRGYTMIMLSIATSIDALAIGLTLAMLKVEIWYPCVVIGFVTGFLSMIGIKIGHILSSRFGRVMEFIGGGVLLLIGVKILSEHLFF